MGSSALRINHSAALLGLDGSECLWGIGIDDLNGSMKLVGDRSTDGAEASDAAVSASRTVASATLRSLNYGVPGLVVVSVVLACFVAATAFGNCLVIVALFRYRSLRTISNFLIGNLALSDLLLAVTILPLSSVNECLGHWVFGRLACNLWLTLDVLYCTASIWNLCVIAFDRFTATLYPLWYHEKRSTKQAAVYVLLIWSISGAICVPPALGWGELSQNYFFNNSTGVFECVLFQSPGYVLYSASGSFYIPFLITFFLYVRIFSLLRRRMRRMRRGWKPAAAERCRADCCCCFCCSGNRVPGSTDQNGRPYTIRKPQHPRPRSETQIFLDVPKMDAAGDASTAKANSSCRSREVDEEKGDEMVVPRCGSGWHVQSRSEGGSTFGDNIYSQPTATLAPRPASTGQLPSTPMHDWIASPIDFTSRKRQGEDAERRPETDICPTGHSMVAHTRHLDADNSYRTKTVAEKVHHLVSLRFSAPEPFQSNLAVSSFPSNPKRTFHLTVPASSLLSPTMANPPTSTAEDCSSRLMPPWGSGASAAGVKNHCCGEDGVGVVTKIDRQMGASLGGGNRASCHSEDGLSMTMDMRLYLTTDQNEDVGVAMRGPPEDLASESRRRLDLGGAMSDGRHALSVGMTAGVARSVSADFSLTRRDWDLSGMGSGNGDAWGRVGEKMGVARAVVGGGTLAAGAGPGRFRRKRRRRLDLRETNATIKMAIIIAFFCGMWMGFFVVYVVRGWCPVSCRVPRELEAFLFWLGYSNSSMNPILYTLFNDDFRKAFQKLLGCYARKSSCLSSRH